MKVKSVMTSTVATVPAWASLADAAKTMWERDCGVVPVVDAEERLCGLITDRDVCMGGLTQGRPLAEVPVHVSMSKNPLACHADDDIASVHALMRQHRIRRVPVIDEQQHVRGIVSLNDLAMAAAAAKGREREGLEAQVAHSLEAICARKEPSMIPRPADPERQLTTGI